MGNQLAFVALYQGFDSQMISDSLEFFVVAKRDNSFSLKFYFFEISLRAVTIVIVNLIEIALQKPNKSIRIRNRHPDFCPHSKRKRDKRKHQKWDSSSQFTLIANV